MLGVVVRETMVVLAKEVNYLFIIGEGEEIGDQVVRIPSVMGGETVSGENFMGTVLTKLELSVEG